MTADQEHKAYREFRAMGYGRRKARAMAAGLARRVAAALAPPPVPCPNCAGRGLVRVLDLEFPNPPEPLASPCPACLGTGVILPPTGGTS